MRFILITGLVIVFTIGLPPVNNHASPPNHDTANMLASHAGDSMSEAGHQETTLLDIRKMSRLDDIIKILETKRVIYVGENHQQYSHHIAQLDIIKAIHKAYPNIAIGMEMFQQPFQQHLDQFILGEITDKEMLKRTEYFTRWRFDYRLYQPILDYAHSNRIPVIALNIEKEITGKVGREGIDALDEEERVKIPAEIDTSNTSYRQRLEAVFQQHPHNENSNFERFLQVQLLWDEGMAARVAAYLQQNPDSKMIVLSGVGHVAFGDGIPDRVARRTAVDSAIVIPGDSAPVEPGIADFIIYPRSAALPPRALMGILMGNDSDQGIAVEGLSPGSAASTAGIKEGDRIVQINSNEITSRADVKLELLNLEPGDEISVLVTRPGLLWGDEQLQFTLELGQ